MVGMREHRDGLLELPAQLKFAAGVLRLPDPSRCDWRCKAYHIAMSEHYSLVSSIRAWDGGRGALDWNPTPLLMRNSHSGEMAWTTAAVAVMCYIFLGKPGRFILTVIPVGVFFYCLSVWCLHNDII